MVTNSSNRSPSPMSMRPNPNSHNPNPRMNQEREGFGARKSFTIAKSAIGAQPKSLIPNTPANSPAEYTRRSSFGRECGIQFQDHEKENERDHNSKPLGRVGHPTISKGTKNFMSPTISAVSKINPSPRKKVLGERNEAIRTSASLSEGKLHFFSASSLEFADENESKEVVVTPPPTFSHVNKLDEVILNKEPEKMVTDFSPVVGKMESETDLVVLSPELVPLNKANSSEIPQIFMPELVSGDKNVGLNVKITTCSSPSITIAPLDADPSLPPYDPKTNFLSPRPQFLHYKPNPRIETYINHGIRFEDDLDSESVAETETSEEVQSQESSSVSVETSSSSSELSSTKSQQLDETDEPEIEAKRQFTGKWKAACLIFFILLGYIVMYQENMISLISGNLGLTREVKFSPLPFCNLTDWQRMEFENYLVKDFELGHSFDKKEDDFELRATSFGEVESEMKRLDDDYEAHKLVLTNQLMEEFEREKLEATCMHEDSVIEDEEFAVEMIEEASYFEEVENQEDEHNEHSSVTEVHPQDDESQLDSKVEDYKSPQVEPQGGESQLDFKVEDDQSPEVEPQSDDSLLNFKVEDQKSQEVHPQDDESQLDSKVEDYQSPQVEPQGGESQLNFKVEDDQSPELEPQSDVSLINSKVEVQSQLDSKVDDYQSPQVEPQGGESQLDFEVEDDQSPELEPQSDDSLINSKVEDQQSQEVEPQITPANDLIVEAEDEGIVHIIEESEGSLASSISVVVSLCVVSLLAALWFVKKPKKEISSSTVNKENSATYIPMASKISHEKEPVEVDMIGDSCPSEMSSFRSTSSYYNPKCSNEAQSMEKSSKRNYKRESLASSSSEYTTSTAYGSFTTYSILHSKQRDDEVVTPVRRSSRIRSKVTSP